MYPTQDSVFDVDRQPEHTHLVRALEALSVAEPGDDVFVDIARTVSEFLGNRWTGIGRIGADGSTIEIIGFWNNGRPGEPYSYPLAGTPCAEVCNRSHPLCIEERVAERYPADSMLGDMGAVSYRGEPLPDQMGKEIGVLWAIDDKPCRDSDTERAFLRVAAKRAALELQRRENERLLAERNEQLVDTLERIGDGFFSLDRDWTFTFVNADAARMFGADWYRLKDQCLWDVLPEAARFFYLPLHKAMKDQQAVRVESFYLPLGGRLEVHVFPSASGVSVYLQNKGKTATADIPSPTGAQPAAEGRILLVDDEPALLGFMEEVLAGAGFQVNAHTDSAKALADFQQAPSRFDLVITDLTMPGLSGTELALELRALRADIPILLCTGYSGGQNMEPLPEQAPCGFLAKPYDSVTLLTRIGGLLSLRRNATDAV